MPGKGQVPYDPWPFQQEFLNCRDRFRIINKPRQCGISTTVAAEVAWEFDNIPGAQIVIISKDKDAAVNFHKYVYNILKSVRINNPNLPKLLKTNERVTTNDLGSQISSLASSKEAGRSFSATHLVFDELAFIEYAEDIWQAANATLSQTKGRVTAISTPKGRANLFARIFDEDGNMGFTVFQYAWWDVPTYNPVYDKYILARNAGNKNEITKIIEEAKKGDWYKSERPKYTDLAWKQEFEGAFDANIGTVFSKREIESVFVRNYLTEKEDPDRVATMWYTSEKKDHGVYYHGADVGRKNDPVTFFVYDCSDYPEKKAKLVEFIYVEPGSATWDEITRTLKKRMEYWESQGNHDGTGIGDVVTGDFEEISDPYYFTAQSKEDMITTMKHAFGSARLKMPKIPIVYREHLRYEFDDKNLVQDTVMGNGLAIMAFYESSNIVSGFRELEYVA